MQSAIFHRSLDKSYPTAVRGEGVYIYTADGKKILDGSSGAAVSSVGHGHPDVIKAIIHQVQNSLTFAHTSFFTSDPAEQLAQAIIAKSENAFSHLAFLSSGSEAVETSLKMCRQFHVYMGEPERVNFIGRMDSYHGNTLGAIAAGNNPSRRPDFAPILSDAFHHVSRCFYDADGANLTEQEYEDKLIAEMEAKITELGPHTVSGVIVEPVVGATLGSVPATANYLPRLKELCTRHGVLLIFDEVMCGMGRVGTYHAWQSFGGVAPDLQTIGKGLAAGYQPLSAVLISGKVYEVFEEHSKGPRKFVSGHTYQGHAVGCAAALAVQSVIGENNLLDNVVHMGALLEKSLRDGLPFVFTNCGGSLRGMGLFRTVDFGKLGQTVGGKPLLQEVADECFEQGAAVYACSGPVDAILFALPFVVSAEEVKALVAIFFRALDTVLQRRQDIA
jgi:adenosylmethionine-8-amino-7-oxononanoate aminotransferase